MAAFAVENFDEAVQMAHFFRDRIENIVGKGEIAGYLFQQYFQKSFLPGL